jgi:hypothetical protein
MANIDPGAYPITIRIKDGILLVQCGDLGITVSRNFDLIHGARDIGELYFDVFKRVSDEISRRAREGKTLPSPTLSKTIKPAEEKFDVPISAAADITGLPEHTLRRLSKEDLPCFKTPKGHRRYRSSDLLRIAREK